MLKALFFSFSLFVLSCHKPEQTTTAAGPEEIVPKLYSIPSGCWPVLFETNSETGTRILESSPALTEASSSQWFNNEAIKALVVIANSEEQLKAHFQCSADFEVPPSGIDFEKTRVYLVFLQHFDSDKVNFSRTTKTNEKTQAEFEVLRPKDGSSTKTKVELMSFIWPVEIRGMGLRFKFKKVEPQ